MKLEIEIDLEGLIENDADEYSFSLEEAVKEQIIDGIINKIYATIKNSYEINISEIINKKIEKLVEETFDDFLQTEVNITDRYGDIKESGTIKLLVKKRFDKWLGETVDKHGRASTSSYDELQKRIEYIIETEMEKRSKSFMDDAVNAVSQRLEETLSEDLRDAIGKKIADKIGLNKILPKMLKK